MVREQSVANVASRPSKDVLISNIITHSQSRIHIHNTYTISRTRIRALFDCFTHVSYVILLLSIYIPLHHNHNYMDYTILYYTYQGMSTYLRITHLQIN